jgi:hypothetical protein
MKKLTMLLLVLVCAWGSAQTRTPNTGNDLIRGCEKAANLQAHTLSADVLMEVGYCQGLVSGVATVLNSRGVISLPKDSTLGQWIRVVVKYMNDHPERLADPDVAVVWQALRAAFPPR